MALKPDTLAKTIIYYNEDVYIYFVEEGLKAVHHSFIHLYQSMFVLLKISFKSFQVYEISYSFVYFNNRQFLSIFNYVLGPLQSK